MMLTDEQWETIRDLLPEPKRRRDGKGRPWAANRACFEGILWVLRTGARWRDLPSRYPSGVTCWRRLRDWEERDVWLDAWRALLGTLDQRGLLRWEETFLDGSFAPAKKGALRSAKPSAARARSGW
jgi:transposase